MTAAPCFANCGQPACRKLGCVRVYNDREEQRQRDGRGIARSNKPMTAGELADALSNVPPETRVYVGGGGFAFKPKRVRWGNRYSLPGSREFVSVDDGE